MLANCRLSEPLAAFFALLRRFLDDVAARSFLDVLLDFVFVRSDVLGRRVEQRIERALAFGLALQGESGFLPGDILVLRFACVHGEACSSFLAHHHALHVQVLVQNRADVARVRGDFLYRDNRLGVDHAVGERCQKRHEEDGHGTCGDERACDVLGHRARFHGHRRHCDDERQRRRAVERHGDAVVHGQLALALAKRERHDDGHGAYQKQRADEQDEQKRVLAHAGEVDLRAGNDEEHGDEEPVADCVELRFKLMVAFGDDVAQNEAGGERAEHDIEAEHGRYGDEPNQKHHCHAHERLRGGVALVHEELVDAMPAAARLCRHDGHDHAYGDEDREDEQRLPFAARREQERHGEHGAQLAPGAERQDALADGGPLEVALLDDRHERAERRRGERDGHGEPVDVAYGEARRQKHENKRDRHADKPGGKPLLPLRSRKALRVDLIACKEEQKRKAKLGEHVD